MVDSDQRTSQRDRIGLSAKPLTVFAAVADDFFLAVPLPLVGAGVGFGSMLVVTLFAGDQ